MSPVTLFVNGTVAGFDCIAVQVMSSGSVLLAGYYGKVRVNCTVRACSLDGF